MIYDLIMRKEDNSCYTIQYDSRKNSLSKNGKICPTISGMEARRNWVHDQQGVVLRIVMGKKCNFSCSYCTQEPARNTELPIKNICSHKKFVERIVNVTSKYGGIQQIQLWGGEPLLYFDTMKELHTLFCELCDKKPIFWYSTNGTLFKGKYFDWTKDNDFSVSFSYDGAGQYLRGKDPLDDHEVLKNVQWYLDNKPDKFQFAPVMTNAVGTHLEYVKFVEEKVQRKINKLSESVFVMCEFDEALKTSLSIEDMLYHSSEKYKGMISGKLDCLTYSHINAHNFLNKLNEPLPLEKTRCVVGDKRVITLTLDGDILVCQNLNAEGVHENTKEKYCYGNIFDTDELILPPMIALKERKQTKCLDCLVNSICKGGCPYMSTKYEEYNCNANFLQYLADLGFALTYLTGDTLHNWKIHEE